MFMFSLSRWVKAVLVLNVLCNSFSYKLNSYLWMESWLFSLHLFFYAKLFDNFLVFIKDKCLLLMN